MSDKNTPKWASDAVEDAIAEGSVVSALAVVCVEMSALAYLAGKGVPLEEAGRVAAAAVGDAWDIVGRSPSEDALRDAMRRMTSQWLIGIDSRHRGDGTGG